MARTEQLERFACLALSVHTWISMQTDREKFMTEFGNAGNTNRLRMQAAFDGPEILAHMKVIAPLTSTGPLVLARVVNASASMLILRFAEIVFAGALVQIRLQGKTVFGIARRCTLKGSEYEIEVEKQEVY
jgi:hypothetical protein